MTYALRSVCFGALLALALFPTRGVAAPNWGVDLAGSTLFIDADTYADNGANQFRPLGIWDEDSPPNVITFTPNFVVGPDTFDLGATLNPISSDFDLSAPFVTSASAVGMITIDGLGSDTLVIRWRANTLNDQFGGDSFASDSSALLNSLIAATIDGVAPGTSVTIGYDWEYFGNAVPDHEAVREDPVSAGGNVTFFDEQGFGPGNLFAVLFSEPGPVGGMSSGSGSYDLVTSNPTSELTVTLGTTSATRMGSPGFGPADEDLAGSEFIGRLTLTLSVVPEPASAAFFAVSLVALSLLRHKRRQ